nr:hypothetical protein [Bradyrhizobium yuanmingense]
MIDILDGVLGQPVDALWVAAQGRAVRHMARDPAIGHDAGNRSDRVGASAEADEKYPITFLIQGYDRCIAVNYVPGDPEARRHTGEVVEPPHPTDFEVPAVGR